MFDRYPPKSVIVGIDGSQASIRAAQWAVGEVVGTDIPLCLLHITKPNPTADRSEARAALAAAEGVVRGACRAIDEMGKPVKVEAEIIDGQPVPALIAASRSTTLICVGDKGSAQHPDAWLGSTAKELAQTAHCSVAIIRAGGHEGDEAIGGDVVARVDESPDDLDVLDLAISQALRRHAPLRVVTTAHPREVQGDREGRVTLDVFLRRVHHDYPELEIDTVPLEGSFLDYVATHAASIRLVMVSSARTRELQQLLGADGELALHGSTCSLMIVGLERLGH
jgi:nucleotide-binding universal stress UspA family protein